MFILEEGKKEEGKNKAIIWRLSRHDRHLNRKPLYEIGRKLSKRRW
jgi:hypothetical protein